MNDPVTMRRKLRVELKRLRTARELTQRNVAERLDWSQSKVIRIENGRWRWASPISRPCCDCTEWTIKPRSTR